MRFVLRRLGFFIVTLWAAVTLNFLIPRLMPGNAVLAMMSRYKGHVNPQAMHALQIAFGIKTHESLVHAYFTYLGNIAQGHFGISLTFFPDTVSHQVLQALPWTLALVGTTTIIAFILGTFIGLISAWRRGGSLDGLLLPNLVGFAMSLGFVVSGAILVEFVFNYPGVGWMFLQSVENQDYALMQALFLMITVAVLLAILVADGATAILDPRTRDRS